MQKILKNAVIFLMVAAMLIISGCSNANEPSGSEIEISKIEGGSESESSTSSENESSASLGEESSTGEGSQNEEPSYEDLKIETPFCTLYYPGDWGTFLETEVDDGKTYSITFKAKLDSGKKQDLFTIMFGDLGEAIGTIKTSDGKTVKVWAASETFKPGDDWTDNEAHIVFTMMDLLNEVLAKMPIEPLEQEQNSSQGSQSQSQNQGNTSGSNASRPGTSELPPDMAEDMALDTPYGELHYPMRWSEYFGVEIGEENGVYRVEFYCDIEGFEPKQMFTVYYGGSEGYTIKNIKNDGKLIEVKLSMEELSFDESWSEDEKRIAYAMQEDVNYLIDGLK